VFKTAMWCTWMRLIHRHLSEGRKEELTRTPTVNSNTDGFVRTKGRVNARQKAANM
jgi:hypothetical protein